MKDEHQKDPNPLKLIKIEAEEILLAGGVDKSVVERRLRRIFYTHYLKRRGIEVKAGEINELIEQIKADSPELQAKGIDTVEANKLAEQISKSGLDHYVKYIEPYLKESSENLLIEAHVRGVLDVIGKMENDFPTELQAFDFFIGKQVENARERMRIKQSRGNKPKHSNQELLEICASYKALRADLETAHELLNFIEKAKKKNKSLRTQKQLKDFTEKLLESVSVAPHILRRLESKQRGHTPCKIALEVTAEKYGLGSPTNCARIVRKANTAF